MSTTVKLIEYKNIQSSRVVIFQIAFNSNRVARVMQDHLGLKRGDVVCVFMPNCAEYVYTWLGMAKLGAVSALINSNLRHRPLLHCIQVAKAKAIIFSEPLASGKCKIKIMYIRRNSLIKRDNNYYFFTFLRKSNKQKMVSQATKIFIKIYIR